MSHNFIVYFSVPVISNLLLLALHVLLTLRKITKLLSLLRTPI